MPRNDDLPVIAFASRREFEDWLEAQAPASPGLWLKTRIEKYVAMCREHSRTPPPDARIHTWFCEF